MCLPGSSVARLMFPVFVGLYFKEKNIFLLRLLEGAKLRATVQPAIFFFCFSRILGNQEFPRIQESKFPRIQISDLDLNCSCIFPDNSCLEVYSSALCFYPSVYRSPSAWVVAVAAFTHRFFVSPTLPSSVVLATRRSARVCFAGK